MLSTIENFGWLVILPVFGLLFTAIWSALNRHSCFSESVSFVIALCVSILCVLSVVGFFTQDSENLQGIDVVGQEEASSQEPQQDKFHYILLSYAALMVSFLLLLMLVKIGLLADGINNFLRPSYGKKEKVSTTDRLKEKQRITQHSELISNDLKSQCRTGKNKKLRK